MIGRDGRIGLLNDWRDPERGGTWAGWANGGSTGLEGPGVGFVRRLGVSAINKRLVSIEHVAREGQALTDAQLAASIALSAAVHQAARTPWRAYPVNPALGVEVQQAHAFFAEKSCPTEPFLSRHRPVILREVRAILTRHQTGAATPAAARGRRRQRRPGRTTRSAWAPSGLPVTSGC